MFIKSVFKNINCISINNIVQQRTPRFYYHTHSETLLTYVFITERRGGGGAYQPNYTNVDDDDLEISKHFNEWIHSQWDV